MLTLKQLRDDKEFAISRLAVKGVDARQTIDRIIELDDARKEQQQKLDKNLSEQNAAAKQIGALFAQGKREEAEQIKARTIALKEESKELDAQLKKTTEELNSVIVTLPNFPAAIVPEGKTAED
ncbi:MAG: serine--tRNA ligase, partial [Tidjanibacter sp.]|nr:serine--tRNA ligase [Tidjanibacter sp.]